MKKIFVFLLVFAFVGSVAFSAANTANYYESHRQYQGGNVKADPLYPLFEDPIYVWVSPEGSDTKGNGSFGTPYKTITAGLSVATVTRNTVMVMPGTYSEVDIVWPSITGIVLIAPFDGVSIVQSTKAATAVITVSPTRTASFSATIENIEIVSDFTAGKCINIANANVTAGNKMNIYLNNVDLSTKAAADFSLVSTGTIAGAIRVYARGEFNTWEGIITWTSFNTGDRLRVYNTRIIGTPTSAAAVISEVSFVNCALKTAITPHSDTLISVIGCWHESDADPDVYTAYTARYSE